MLRFVPEPNVPIATHERRYGRKFEVMPIRSYDSSEWIEDMETYLDIEPALPAEIERQGEARYPSAQDEVDNVLEAMDFDTKYQYIDRVLGRTVLPTARADRGTDALPVRFEPTPTRDALGFGFGTETPVATPSKTNTYLFLGALALGGYMLYKVLSEGHDEIPAHKLPRYAGGRRKL